MSEEINIFAKASLFYFRVEDYKGTYGNRPCKCQIRVVEKNHILAHGLGYKEKYYLDLSEWIKRGTRWTRGKTMFFQAGFSNKEELRKGIYELKEKYGKKGTRLTTTKDDLNIFKKKEMKKKCQYSKCLTN